MAQVRTCFQLPVVAHSGGGERGFLPFGTQVGDYLFSGGCMGQDPATGVVASGAAEQAKFAFQNVQALMDTAGFSTNDIVRMWIWVKDHSLTDIISQPWQEMFPDPGSRPAASIIAADLPGEMVVQLEIVARKSGQRRSIYLGDTEGTLFPSGSVKGDLLCAGSFNGVDPKTRVLSDDAVIQSSVAHEKLQMVMEAANCGLDSLGHMLVWYKDHSVREVNNGPYASMWPVQNDRPARHSVIRPMPAGQMTQVEAMGVIGGGRTCHYVDGIWHGGIQGIDNSLPFGVTNGNLVFSAATYGRDLATGDHAATSEGQAEWAFRHTKTLMDTAGVSMDDIGHMFVWYLEHGMRNSVNGPWVESFSSKEDRPARHAISSDLPGGMNIQIEVIAVKP